MCALPGARRRLHRLSHGHRLNEAHGPQETGLAQAEFWFLSPCFTDRLSVTQLYLLPPALHQVQNKKDHPWHRVKSQPS